MDTNNLKEQAKLALEKLEHEAKEESKQFFAKSTTYKIVAIALAVGVVIGAILF